MNPKPTNSQVAVSDEVGAATLELLSAAPAYNRWMFDRISNWIGSHVLEIGAGIGNISQFLIDRDQVILSDPESAYRAVLQQRFGEARIAQRRMADVAVDTERRSGHDRRARHIAVVDMSLPTVPPELVARQFDTIVCLNVLEHVENDLASLETMHALLEPGGRLVLLVPALSFLYGTIDRALGHYRRYTPRQLRSRFDQVGLALRHLEYFNLAGIPGWWFAGRVLRRRLIPTGLLTLYDKFVPIFRLERFLPLRIGQSLIAIGERL
jgi:SAM-dependent methyltransferase